MTEKPLYNSKILLTFVNLLKARYPHVDPDTVLRHAGIKPYEVSEGGQWFTQTQVDLFMEKAVQLTGNADIAREGGRYAASLESLGVVGKHLLALIGPANAFLAISKANSLTKSAVYQSRRLSANKVEITVTPAPGVEERPYQCQNRIGFFEAMLMIYNYQIPAIEHPECIFRGDASCRYLVSWKKSQPARVRDARNLLALAVTAGSCVLSFSHPWQALAVGVPLLVTSLLTGTLIALRMENGCLHAALSNLKESTDELLEQTTRNYNNALMVNEVGQAISKQADEGDVLENIVKALENRLGYDRGLILLADPEGKRLSFRVGFGYDASELSVLGRASFNLEKPDLKGVFVRCFKTQEPVLVNDFTEISAQHSAHSVKIAELLGANSFICCAIVCEGISLGILAVDNVRTNRALTLNDKRLLTGVAPVIGMSIRNAAYIERERRRFEQMRQSQKMEAIGELAGGVAHDFNNLLTAIIGFTTLAQFSTDKQSESYPYLEEVLLASERAAHLTRGLLAFGRRQPVTPKPCDLNAIVGEMEKLLRRLLSAEIDLSFSLYGQPLVIMTDSAQVDQVLLNLATNARDAMSNSGTLTIETSPAEIDSLCTDHVGIAHAGSYARLTVRDTGKGIDEATRAQMFDPFFTTKEVGKGTGLGLAIVYGVVQQLGGFIEIESSPGAGASFHVYLPLIAQEAAPTERPRVFPHREPRGETILVVEDSPEVRRLTSELLQRHGYRVVEAEDGQEGLEKFLAHRHEVKLVIMDVVMPKMNGKEAFAAISRDHPDLKVLFTSGYTPEEIDGTGIPFDRDNFIAKPADPRALLNMVDRLLSKGRKLPPDGHS